MQILNIRLIIVNETEANGKGAIKPLMYYICSMAHEIECDIVLYEISEAQENDGGFASFGITYDELSNIRSNANTEAISNNWGTITSILIVDGFIERIPSSRNYKITTKGIAFLATDKYVNRAKRWKLQQDKNEQELRKLNWEVSKLGVTYRLAWAAFILSIINAVPNSSWHQLYAKLQQLLQLL